MSKQRKTICVFTGTRAEYGILKPLMQALAADKSFHFRLVVSGMHLSREFGSTYREIEKDGFKINAKVDLKLTSDDPSGICRSVATGVAALGEAFKKINPDCVVILGDRFEAFAAACACLFHCIPVAHLYGGASTFKSIDEALRHSMTKMSQLHFTSSDEYRRRIIQMGEQPAMVHNVGSLGLDSIRQITRLTTSELEAKLGFSLFKRNLLVTYHPVTLDVPGSIREFETLLRVLSHQKDSRLIFTKANADTGGRKINRMLEAFVKNHPQAKVFVSMGHELYLQTMAQVDAVVGNSSSGIIEAPSFKVATINIGGRQDGRIRAGSIIDTPANGKSIEQALKKLYSPSFQAKLRSVVNPFGDGTAAPKIIEILKLTRFDQLLAKKFYDIKI